MELTAHPVAQCFPPLTATEYKDLKADITAHGIRVPIVTTTDGQIVDGVHRHRAAQETGRGCPTQRLPKGQDPWVAGIALNLARRHLDESQRAMVAHRLSRESTQAHQKRSANSQNALTQTQAAEVMGVGTRAVSEARKVDEAEVPELVAAVDKGKREGGIAVSDGARIAGEERQTIIEALEMVETGEAKTATAAVETIKKQTQTAAPKPAPPDGKYSVIVVDPPWPVEAMIRTKAVPNEGVDVPYATMELEDIARLPVEDLADSNAWVFLWATQRFLPAAFDMLDDWHFKYRFTLAWNKKTGFKPVGGPTYNTEFVVVGTIGSPTFEDTKAFATSTSWPNPKGHSVKPDGFYDLLERVCGDSAARLDMFARRQRPGWIAWGLEIDNG